MLRHLVIASFSSMGSQTHAPFAQLLYLSSAAQMGRAACWRQKLLTSASLVSPFQALCQSEEYTRAAVTFLLACISNPSLSAASLLGTQMIIVLCSEGTQLKDFAAPITMCFPKHLKGKPVCHSVACVASDFLLQSRQVSSLKGLWPARA